MVHDPIPVALVGAGPGHPGLLTLRAVECLSRADLVLYDQLVPPRMLEHAPATARRICVKDLHESHPERAPLVNQLLIDAARQGLRVVRLKGGDPFLFGRGAEEADALRQAGLAYEVVPGVTAALGAAAFAGIPLTHRLESSAVALVTGHEKTGKPGSESDGHLLDWPALARFPGTLVVYMGLARLPAIVQTLLDHGKAADTPAIAIQRGTTSEQRLIEAPLAKLPAAVQSAELVSPTLIIIGSVVALRSRLAWVEQLPLFGKRILVTRPRGQAGDMVRALEELGATVAVMPLLEVHEPSDWGPVDRALLNLQRYQWLVFTSANGVHACLRRLRHLGRDLRALGHLSLATIGPATAEALRGYYLQPDLVPPEYRSESLAASLAERVRGQRVLLARADRGREVLREQLAAVAEVEQVAVYVQVDSLAVDPALVDEIRQGRIDFITLTSSNIARALVHSLDDGALAALRDGRVELVSISPVTSAVIRELGLPVAAEAKEYTTAGVVAAIRATVEARGKAPART
jgi:uroporphyrinogen III methyltransferase/synthase